MAFSTPVVGSLVKKGLQKGRLRAPQNPPGYTLVHSVDIVCENPIRYLSMESVAAPIGGNAHLNLGSLFHLRNLKLAHSIKFDEHFELSFPTGTDHGAILEYPSIYLHIAFCSLRRRLLTIHSIHCLLYTSPSPRDA